MVIENIINFLKTYRKQLLLYGILFVVLFSLIAIVTRYALINVSVVKPDTADKPIVYLSSDRGTVLAGEPGLRIISRDTKSIIVQAGKNIRTQSEITMPWYGYADKKVELRPDKNADKIAYKSSLNNACGVYSDNLKRMLQYSCNNSNVLVHYRTPDKGAWLIEKVSDAFYPDYTPVSYMGGLIGIEYVKDTDFIPPSNIVSISETGQKNYLNNPEGIDTGQINRAGIFTDQHDQTNNRFVLATADGTIYLGTPTSGSNVNYVKIDSPSSTSSKFQETSCSVNGDRAVCYRGLSQNTGDSVIDYNSIDSSILKLNFTNDTREVFKVDRVMTLHNFVVTSDGEMYGKNHKKLFYFEKNNTEYKVKELSQNIDAVAAGENVYFLQNGGVFSVDPKSHDSYQVFHSPNIKPEKILASAGKVFILGKVPTNKNFTFAWALNDEDDANYGERLIDKLPSFPTSTTYGRTDLVGNTIKIDIFTGRSTTKQSIENSRQATLDYLDSIGVDTSKLTLNN